jgi:valyl-tRNA synthetase
LITAYDILFFWVARMILMSTYFLGEVPFKTVYLHGLVRDAQGRKMSKSLGNIMDPITMIDKFGTDATRLSLIIGTGPGNDSKFSEDKTRGYKNFANKIWNATRYVLTATPDFDWESVLDDGKSLPAYTTADLAHKNALGEIVKDVTSDMENFRYYLAGEKLYHYFWHTFADIIIEESKKNLESSDETVKNSTKRLLVEILVTTLKLMHPFIPFVTEEIWSLLPFNESKTEKRLLIVEKWPK